MAGLTYKSQLAVKALCPLLHTLQGPPGVQHHIYLSALLQLIIWCSVFCAHGSGRYWNHDMLLNLAVKGKTLRCELKTKKGTNVEHTGRKTLTRRLSKADGRRDNSGEEANKR